MFAQNNMGGLEVGQDGSLNGSEANLFLSKPRQIHSVIYEPSRYRAPRFSKNPKNYVPSGTFARAVVLGGVDADASVEGQNKNNGVMLFKVRTYAKPI
jgi:conjugal transfer pilus assembly protein TraB